MRTASFCALPVLLALLFLGCLPARAELDGGLVYTIGIEGGG